MRDWLVPNTIVVETVATKSKARPKPTPARELMLGLLG